MRNRKWLVIGLIVSVAVNLALAGFVAGKMSGSDRPAMLDPSLSLFRVLRELPDPRRDEFRPVLHEHFRLLRGDIRRLRQAQRGIDAALAREPFEPESLARALQDFRSALLDTQQKNHRMLVDVSASMTAGERQMLVQAMERPRRHHHRSRDGDGHDAGGRGPER